MKKSINKARLFGSIVASVLAATMLCSCGGETKGNDPWDYSCVPSSESLILEEASKKRFTGIEWTGKNFTKDIDGNTVCQSDIVRVNTLDYHSVGTVVYDSVENALNGSREYDRTKSGYYKLLTGENNTWQLAVYKNEDKAKEAGVLDEFYKPSYNMATAPKWEGENKIYSSNNAYYGGFKDVTLPSSWQVQGFDFPIYTNTVYPWADGAYGNERVFAPVTPTITNPVGFYRYEFDIDQSWIDSNRRVYISFGGVESAYYVYVNGYEVGYSEDTFDAADFDITPYLNKDGKKNLLAVKVHRWCDGSYFENQDFLRLAGIFRDVYIYSTTGVRIADYTVVTDLDSSFVNAELKVNLKIDNTTVSTASNYKVDIKLFDADKNDILASSPLRKAVPTISSGKSGEVYLSKKITKPHLWSDEDPYLYTMVISLYDDNGAYYGSIAQQLGFRELTFTPTVGTTENEHYDTVLLNGKTFKFRGVDRHDLNPETGRYLPMELYEKDILIMKSLNINAVRTSHYPDDENFYNMCDKYGILVLGECNVETHYNVSGDDTETYFSKVVQDRIMAHTTAYKNRTCILVWSMGNETIGGTKTFLDCIQDLKQRDPTRPIHFESLGSGSGVDIASTMYSSADDVRWRGTWENHMPYLTCEYAHAMGNSVGNLLEYWKAYRSSDSILGGFIWDFVDQSIWTEVPSNKYDYYGNGKYLAYGGCWGDNPNSGDFCQNGIISPDRSIQPEAEEVRYCYQFVWFKEDKNLSETNKTVKITNEYRFTDLSEFDIKYELVRNGVVIDSGILDVSCEPLSDTTVEVPYELPKDQANSEYHVNFFVCLKNDNVWAKAGTVVAKEQLAIKSGYNRADIDTSAMATVSVKEENGDIIVTGNDFEAVFASSTGILSSYTYKGEEIIEKGPAPNFKRARLSNDNVLGTLDNAKTKKVHDFKYELSADSKSVTITARLELNAGDSFVNMSYTVYGGGEIKVSSKLELSNKVQELVKYGSVLTLPSDYEYMTFHGRGPVDTYNDRCQGSLVGIYSQTVSDSFYPYGKPQDTGNKTDIRYIALTSKLKDTGILVACDGLLQASAIHYTPTEIENARYTYDLPTSVSKTYLNIDFGSRGTGGASCGPETLPKYKLMNDSTKYEYSYTIIPFGSSDDIASLAEMWREEK